MTDIVLTPVTDFAALGERWRALEARADGSFFQSWTWTGCLAEERFPDPVLLEAREDGRTVALALFNRRRLLRETLFLGESGDGEHDSPFIEYNGVLTARGAAVSDAAISGAAVSDGAVSDAAISGAAVSDGAVPGVVVSGVMVSDAAVSDAAVSDAAVSLGDCLRAARGQPVGMRRPRLPRRLVLNGIDDATLAAACAAGPVASRRSMPAPFIDLAGLRAAGRSFLDGLSANTRYQLRRSDRIYGTLGLLQSRHAETAAEAHAWLDELETLHQVGWTARGQPGAFARPFFARFHHALIDRGMARGEIELLRVTAGARVVGLLYNFRYRGRLLAYQGGFAYAEAGPHQKPGLTSHHQAIRRATEDGMDCYDFLAGEDRYKRSMAGDATTLHWVEIGPARRFGRLARLAARGLGMGAG